MLQAKKGNKEFTDKEELSKGKWMVREAGWQEKGLSPNL